MLIHLLHASIHIPKNLHIPFRLGSLDHLRHLLMIPLKLIQCLPAQSLVFLPLPSRGRLNSPQTVLQVRDILFMGFNLNRMDVPSHRNLFHTPILPVDLLQQPTLLLLLFLIHS